MKFEIKNLKLIVELHKLLRKFKNIYHLFQAVLANTIYGFPAKKIICIGVTGTDGKSTVCNLIYHILRSSGEKAGVISTVGCKINDEDYSIGFHTTTPTSFALQKILLKMVNAKCKYAVIEVASHGIDQKRIWGIPFEVGVLTNITREHLDYHRDMRKYTKVKMDFLDRCKNKIFNFQFSNTGKFLSYGIGKGDYRAINIRRGSFNLQIGKITNEIYHNLLGEFNVENILAAVVACDVLGVKMESICNGVMGFKGIKGRLEEIKNSRGLHAFVDFAHTPNAITQVLKTLHQEFPSSKIIHVFGATGKRDREKRPLMGGISGKMADISIITTEDTYGENPQKIISMIEEGIKKTGKVKNVNYFVEADRRKALEMAVKMAHRGDVVIATGVGHQTSLNVGREVAWSDQDELKKILK